MYDSPLSVIQTVHFNKIALTIFSHEIGSFWTFEFTNELLFSIDLTANLETAIFWNHIIKILAAWIFGFINWFFIFIFLIIWFFFIVFTSDTSTEWLVEFPDSFFIFFAFSLGISFEGLAKVCAIYDRMEYSMSTVLHIDGP